VISKLLQTSHKDFSENDILKEYDIRSGKANVKENAFYNKGSL